MFTAPVRSVGNMFVLLSLVILLGGCDLFKKEKTASAEKAPMFAELQAFETNEDVGFDASLSVRNAGGAIDYELATSPLKGSVVLDALTGNFHYEPKPDANGDDGFTVKVESAQETDYAFIQIKILPVKDAPVAQALSFTTSEDVKLQGNLKGINRDSNEPFLYKIGKAPARGVLSLDSTSNGAFSYTPNENVGGDDEFTYTVSDGLTESPEAVVKISIQPVNDAPVAMSVTFEVDEDTNLTGKKLVGSDPDGDTFTFALASNGAKGNVILVNATTGQFSYTPRKNLNGEDKFKFLVQDGTLVSEIAEVTIKINPVNDAPTAIAANLETNEDTILNATLKGADVDADALSFALGEPPRLGVASIDAKTGLLSYQPNSNANGSDSLTFTVNDGKLNSAPVKININVKPVNDAPVVAPINVSVRSSIYGGDKIFIPVMDNVSDVDGDTVTFFGLDQPAEGTASYDESLRGIWYQSVRSETSRTITLNFHVTDGNTTASDNGNGASRTDTVGSAVIMVTPAFTTEDLTPALISAGQIINYGTIFTVHENRALVRGTTNGSTPSNQLLLLERQGTRWNLVVKLEALERVTDFAWEGDIVTVASRQKLYQYRLVENSLQPLRSQPMHVSIDKLFVVGGRGIAISYSDSRIQEFKITPGGQIIPGRELAFFLRGRGLSALDGDDLVVGSTLGDLTHFHFDGVNYKPVGRIDRGGMQNILSLSFVKGRLLMTEEKGKARLLSLQNGNWVALNDNIDLCRDDFSCTGRDIQAFGVLLEDSIVFTLYSEIASELSFAIYKKQTDLWKRDYKPMNALPTFMFPFSTGAARSSVMLDQNSVRLLQF